MRAATDSLLMPTAESLLLEVLQSESEYNNVWKFRNRKTHLATTVGIRGCEAEYTASFKTTAGLVNELKEAKNEKQLVKYAKIFKKYDVVILD